MDAAAEKHDVVASTKKTQHASGSLSVDTRVGHVRVNAAGSCGEAPLTPLMSPVGLPGGAPGTGFLDVYAVVSAPEAFRGSDKRTAEVVETDVETARRDWALFAEVTDTSIVVPTSYADTTTFEFAKVFWSVEDVEPIFQSVAPVVHLPTRGLNSAVMTYGQRGLGKTRIMEGTTAKGGSDVVGIIPRALNELFALRKRTGIAISLSMFEASGDSVNDLLSSAALIAAGVPPEHVKPACWEKVPVNEVYMGHRHLAFSLLHQAARARHARTPIPSPPKSSSPPSAAARRSTARGGHFFTIVRVESGGGKVGMLYLIDLAGTEDASSASMVDPHSTGSAAAVERGQALLKTRLAVNSDLYHFERMVRSRAAGEEFIPSKSCALTRVLSHAFSDLSKAALVVPLSPKETDRKRTMHSLNFGHYANDSKEARGWMPDDRTAAGSAASRPGGSGAKASPTSNRLLPSPIQQSGGTKLEASLASSPPRVPTKAELTRAPVGRNSRQREKDLRRTQEAAALVALDNPYYVSVDPESPRHTKGLLRTKSASAIRNSSKESPKSKKGVHGVLEELEKVRSTNTKLRTQIARLENQVSVHELKLQHVKDGSEQRAKDFKALQGKLKAAEKALATMTTKLRRSQEKASATKHLQAQLDARSEALEAKHEEMELRTELLEKKNSQLEQQLQASEAKLREARSEKQRADAKIKRLKLEIQRDQSEAAFHVDDLNLRRTELKQHLLATQTCLAEVNEELNTAKKRIESLEEQRETAEVRIDALLVAVESEKKIAQEERERCSELSAKLVATDKCLKKVSLDRLSDPGDSATAVPSVDRSREEAKEWQRKLEMADARNKKLEDRITHLTMELNRVLTGNQALAKKVESMPGGSFLPDPATIPFVAHQLKSLEAGCVCTPRGRRVPADLLLNGPDAASNLEKSANKAMRGALGGLKGLYDHLSPDGPMSTEEFLDFARMAHIVPDLCSGPQLEELWNLGKDGAVAAPRSVDPTDFQEVFIKTALLFSPGSAHGVASSSASGTGTETSSLADSSPAKKPESLESFDSAHCIRQLFDHIKRHLPEELVGRFEASAAEARAALARAEADRSRTAFQPTCASRRFRSSEKRAAVTQDASAAKSSSLSASLPDWQELGEAEETPCAVTTTPVHLHRADGETVPAAAGTGADAGTGTGADADAEEQNPSSVIATSKSAASPRANSKRSSGSDSRSKSRTKSRPSSGSKPVPCEEQNPSQKPHAKSKSRSPLARSAHAPRRSAKTPPTPATTPTPPSSGNLKFRPDRATGDGLSGVTTVSPVGVDISALTKKRPTSADSSLSGPSETGLPE